MSLGVPKMKDQLNISELISDNVPFLYLLKTFGFLNFTRAIETEDLHGIV